MFKNFFTLLILFFLAYYIVKAIFKIVQLLFPRKTTGNFFNSGHNRDNISMDNSKKQKKRFSKDSGEYIDYEDVK